MKTHHASGHGVFEERLFHPALQQVAAHTDCQDVLKGSLVLPLLVVSLAEDKANLQEDSLRV